MGLLLDGTLKRLFSRLFSAPPNCTISNAQTIEITFQDVLLMTLMAAIMSKPCRIPLPANGGSRPINGNDLELEWHTKRFDNAAVSSNITGLGIQLKQAGRVLRSIRHLW